MPNKSGFKVRGVPEMRWNIRQIAQGFPGMHEQAQLEETKVDFIEVQKRTPRRFGWLQESEQIEGPYRQNKKVITAITAGDSRAWYAIIVHEDLEAFHPTGQAKFIESVIMESNPYYAERISKRIDLQRLNRHARIVRRS